MGKRFLLPLLLTALLLAACARQPAGAPEETSAPVETAPESALPSSGTGETIGAGESVLADYKPAGYSGRIGAALAIRLDAEKDDPAKRFDAVLHIVSVSAQGTEPPPPKHPGEWLCLDVRRFSVNGETRDAYRYYASLTAKEVSEAAKAGYACSYIGSGRDGFSFDLNTPRGLRDACEAFGDGYTFTANGQIRFRPDTRTEGEKAESFFSVRRTEN